MKEVWLNLTMIIPVEEINFGLIDPTVGQRGQRISRQPNPEMMIPRLAQDEVVLSISVNRGQLATLQFLALFPGLVPREITVDEVVAVAIELVVPGVQITILTVGQS